VRLWRTGVIAFIAIIGLPLSLLSGALLSTWAQVSFALWLVWTDES